MAKRQTYKEIIELAENGDLEEQLFLGTFYYCNSKHKKAAYWYQKAAEQGHEVAQCRLGFMYEYGQGVEQNYEQALYWYNKAAEQNCPDAYMYIGDCYKHGHGLGQSYWLAACNYSKAAEYFEGPPQNQCGLEDSRGRAAWCYFKAAEQGHAGAQFALAECYRLGSGVKQDMTQAQLLYKLAAKYGNEEAKECLKKYFGEENK